MSNVISLSGPPTTEPTVIQSCVETLREWLARAEAGECIGVCIVGLHHNGLASYDIAGVIGGYGVIGAAQIVTAELVDMARGED